MSLRVDRCVSGRLLLLITVLLASAPSLRAGEQSGEQPQGVERFEEERARLVAGGGYDLELPGPLERPEPPSLNFGLFWQLLEIFGWMLLAAVVIVVVGLLVRAFMERKAARKKSEEEDAAGLLENVDLAVDMDEVERLATSGSYGEAIHLLLLRTIGELVRLAGIDIRPAWTSREIASSIPIADEPRHDLQDLVRRAELGHFAERPASESDYRAAREVFSRFVGRLKGAGS